MNVLTRLLFLNLFSTLNLCYLNKIFSNDLISVLLELLATHSLNRVGALALQVFKVCYYVTHVTIVSLLMIDLTLIFNTSGLLLILAFIMWCNKMLFDFIIIFITIISYSNLISTFGYNSFKQQCLILTIILC